MEPGGSASAGGMVPRISMSPLGPLTSLLSARQVVYQLARRRVVLRYRGSLLGVLWSFIGPALTLGIYTLVFGIFLRARWSSGDSTTTEYAFLLYLGLCVYWFLTECVSEAPMLIRNNANYVKKVVFPLEILPWVSVADAAFHGGIRLLVFAVALLFIEGALPWTFVLLPLVWLPLLLWTLGLCWMLSAAGVFVRDLREVVSLMLVALLFLSPIFYSTEGLPELARTLIGFNPIATPVMQTREVAYLGVLPDLYLWLRVAGASAIFAWSGYALFARSRGAFADVV